MAKNRLRYWILLLVVWLTVLILGTGCSHKIVVLQKNQGPDIKKYNQGVDNYWSGKYSQAQENFASLLEETEDPGLERKARFAQTCSVLAVAESSEDLNTGIRLWENWDELAPEDFYYENPRLVFPVLKNYHQNMIAAEGEVTEQKAQNKKYRLEIKRLKKENTELNEKIQALENLYQDLQYKRKNL
ncbi:MAG: hypothetical protein R6U55_12120 [Desulfovermiculus sp.]